MRFHRRKAFTIIDLLASLAVIAVLAGMLMPSLGRARQLARMAVCASRMHNIHSGLMSYAAAHHERMPPFAFSDMEMNLPISGHWGGADQPGDPTVFGRQGMKDLNLWALVLERCVVADQLICPSSEAPLASGQASHFPYTGRFSTYGLRFPVSEDVFGRWEVLAYRNGESLLEVYRFAAGGQDAPADQIRATVPLLRLDRVYRLTADVSAGDGDFDPSGDALLSDGFWRQDYHAETPELDGRTTWPVRWGWCHGDFFNALYGGGRLRRRCRCRQLRDNRRSARRRRHLSGVPR